MDTTVKEENGQAQASAALPSSSIDANYLGGAKPSPELDAFVKNLRIGEINDNVLSFPGDICLGGDAKLKFLLGKLYVRECYTDLGDIFIKLACSQKKLLLDGTPGIGKSFFTFYLMHKLIGMKQTIVWKPAGSTDMFVCMTPTATYFARNVRVFEKQLKDPSTWYIVDGILPEDFPATTLLVTSINHKMSNPYEERGGEPRYMPVWNMDELTKAHAAGVARAQDGKPKLKLREVEKLMRKWGGVPRYVFQFAHNLVEQESLKKAVDSMDMTKLLAYMSDMSKKKGVIRANNAE